MPLQYAIEGSITTPSGGLSSGARFTGLYTIDTEAGSGGNSGSNFFTYATGDVQLLIFDPSIDAALLDTVYAVDSQTDPATQILDRPTVPTSGVDFLSAELNFASGAFDSVDLVDLPTQLLLPDFSELRIELFALAGQMRPGDAVFSVTSITPVPLPAAAWLFLTGLLGLRFQASRHKRRQVYSA